MNNDNQILTGESLYDFSGRLTAEFPSQIIMDITEVCNLACTHCPHPTFKKSEHYAARFLDHVARFHGRLLSCAALAPPLNRIGHEA